MSKNLYSWIMHEVEMENGMPLQSVTLLGIKS
jgi:hypothetical protein